MIHAANVPLPSPQRGRGEKGRGCAAFSTLDATTSSFELEKSSEVVPDPRAYRTYKNSFDESTT